MVEFLNYPDSIQILPYSYSLLHKGSESRQEKGESRIICRHKSSTMYMYKLLCELEKRERFGLFFFPVFILLPFSQNVSAKTKCKF